MEVSAMEPEFPVFFPMIFADDDDNELELDDE